MDSSEQKKDWRYEPQKLDKFHLIITGRIIIVIGFLAIGLLLFHAESGYAVNVFTGFVSIFGSVYIIDTLARNREEERELRRRKDELVRQLRSRDNDTVLIALETLRDEGWLDALEGKNLSGGNFQDADLIGVNLKGTNLTNTNLQRTKLAGTNFRGACLRHADLTGAIFWENGINGEQVAQLQGADLSSAILQSTTLNFLDLQEAKIQNVDLRGMSIVNANLSGADLLGSNLSGAFLNATILRYARLMSVKLEDAKLYDADLEFAALDFSRSIVFPSATFNENTFLPDGQKYKTELGIQQLQRFTDPFYEGADGFWRSEHPEYRKYSSTYVPKNANL